MTKKHYPFKTLLIALLAIFSFPSQGFEKVASSTEAHEGLAANLLEEMISITRNHATEIPISAPNKDLIHLCILDLTQELHQPIQDFLERNILDLSKLLRTANAYAKFLASIAEERESIQQSRNLQDGLIKNKASLYRKQQNWSGAGPETLESWFRQSKGAAESLSKESSRFIVSILDKNFKSCRSNLDLATFFNTLEKPNLDLTTPVKYKGTAFTSPSGGISFSIVKTSGK